MASSKVQILNELNFDSVLASATVPVLVDFGADWCAPCKVQSKILDRIAEESSAVLIAMVDADECPELAARFGVRGLPTLIAFDRGKETARRLGLANEAAIRAIVTPSRTSSRRISRPPSSSLRIRARC
jgi:thioredoxin 1